MDVFVVCADKIKGCGSKFYSKQAMMCGNYIESQYYNPKTGTKDGKIVVSDDVCAICHVQDDIVSPDKKMVLELNLGGKTPLPICRGCFDGDQCV
ncbi:hypothetical protein QTG54_014111 [Skeletonema marinoi]|uniref:Uncharacterized protein n=1 Tax=Skeletonema marinoi TaxID=267567 RepID=A0AAD9D6U4_9STRA|nr:hypothetical protein QTG54_014111 [Skeletonema marinoi]|mmetsp:Transcript_5032/g.8548  ORF Transcript_5032/g.8548 Transcript_5032/m.8548 type:complete len:95 (+) Transcript_5032:71-355(+)